MWSAPACRCGRAGREREECEAIELLPDERVSSRGERRRGLALPGGGGVVDE